MLVMRVTQHPAHSTAILSLLTSVATAMGGSTLPIPQASSHQRVWICTACENAPAAVTCKADAAYLCSNCDVEIHSVNALARRHHRVPISPISGTTMLEPLVSRLNISTRNNSTASCSLPAFVKKRTKTTALFQISLSEYTSQHSSNKNRIFTSTKSKKLRNRINC